MSGAYLPIIQQLSECGRAAAAKLIVKGNQVHAEVVLHAAKAHELDASWLASHLSGGAGADNLRASSGGRSSAVFEHSPIPPKPTRIRFRVPPGWPPPPEGWEQGRAGGQIRVGLRHRAIGFTGALRTDQTLHLTCSTPCMSCQRPRADEDLGWTGAVYSIARGVSIGRKNARLIASMLWLGYG